MVKWLWLQPVKPYSVCGGRLMEQLRFRKVTAESRQRLWGRHTQVKEGPGEWHRLLLHQMLGVQLLAGTASSPSTHVFHPCTVMRGEGLSLSGLWSSCWVRVLQEFLNRATAYCFGSECIKLGLRASASPSHCYSPVQGQLHRFRYDFFITKVIK